MNNSPHIDPLLTKIYNLLYRLGVRARTLGFFEASCAIFLVMKNPERLERSVRDVYHEIAEVYHIDADSIDSHIRHLIRVIWVKKPPFLREILGDGTPLNQYPSPKRFIGILCRYLNAEFDHYHGDFSRDARNTI